MPFSALLFWRKLDDLLTPSVLLAVWSRARRSLPGPRSAPSCVDSWMLSWRWP